MEKLNEVTKGLKGYKTYIGALIMMASIVTGIISEEEAQTLTEMVLAIVGFGITIYGRFNANK